MPWPDCAPSHSLPDGGGGNRPPSGQPNVPANSRQSGLRVPLAASSPRYLALTNIRRRSQSLPAATEDRHRPPSTPNRARTIALPCPYRPFRCCIVIPSVNLGLGSSEFLNKKGIKNIEELGGSDTISIGGIDIGATFAEHPGFRFPFGPATPAIGYIIEGSMRIYFAGDTDLFPEMEGLGSPLDVALLPVGGWGFRLGPGHLNPQTATKALGLLRPRLAVPIHWGTFWPAGLLKIRQSRFSQPGREFAELSSVHAPGTAVYLTEPGRQVEIPNDFWSGR